MYIHTLDYLVCSMYHVSTCKTMLNTIVAYGTPHREVLIEAHQRYTTVHKDAPLPVTT